MANQSVLELAVGTGKWDAGLRKAKQALDNFTQSNGGLQRVLTTDTQKMQQFVSMMGKMESNAKTAKGQMADYKSTIEQLTMQYNRMTEAQRKTIGQDYLQAIEQLKQKYQQVNQELQSINGSLNSSGTPSGGGFLAGGKMEGMLSVLGGNLMTKGVMMAANFASELGGAVVQGIELAKQGEGIRIAFERLGRGDILDGLREATHGTVTDLELMKAAVKFNDFGLPVEELGTMLAFAQQKAKDTGQSVDYMVESIVTGLGRKSLMILDNLGLSAADIKEKMKETGDMTKAVGAIIREQMSKAGEYVETAADRATKADVDLKNAMEELGRTFQPLADSGTSMFNALKKGAIDALNAMRPMLDTLTRVGRARNAFEGMGGNSQVQGLITTLTGSDDMNTTYAKQMMDFSEQIRTLKTQIANGGKMPGAGSGESRDVRWLQGQLDAVRKMRDEYDAMAKDIMNPKETPVATVTPTTPTKPTKETKETYTPVEGSIDYQIQKVRELQDAFNKAADQGVRQGLLAQLKEAEGVLKLMKTEAPGEIFRGGSSYELSQFTGMDRFKDVKIEGKDLEKLQGIANAGEAAKDSWDAALGAISGLGGALAGIEDPAVKVLGIIAEAIATVALTFAKSLKGTITPWDWIAGAAAGTATMISTIAAIKSATAGSFANGGIVPGNNHSDGLIANVSSGELILNAAQQNAVASRLQQQNSNNKSYQPSYVSGEQIWVAMNRYLKRSGQGEVLTWKS